MVPNFSNCLFTAKTKVNKSEHENSENFFEKAVISAKQEIKREKVEEKRRERTDKFEEVITLVQYQVKFLVLFEHSKFCLVYFPGKVKNGIE